MEDFVEIDLGSDGEVIPPKNDKIALIDADTVAYAACVTTEEEADILPKKFYIDSEWEEIENNPNFVGDDDGGFIYMIDLDLAYQKAVEKIDRILDKTGCQKAELFFTGGRKNFRYDLTKGAEHKYKDNRTDMRTPVGLRDLKDKLLGSYEGRLDDDFEADDVVVYKKTKSPEKFILCAVDKDVLNAVEGKHFNYYESEKFDKNMTWYETDAQTALKWPFMQTLMGDRTDNIIGLHRVGPKKAEKLLSDCETKKELWESVVKAYEAGGRTKEDALLNYNLVCMTLLQGDCTIKLEDFKDL